MKTIINAQGLSKMYGGKFALKNFSFELGAGRIMGLIGPNGAGKTTALRCLMGMATYQGRLSVLGRDPQQDRCANLNEVAYVADTGILPSWMTVAQLLEYTAGVHPNFDLARANRFLQQTEISRNSEIKTLSKGMVTQVHLALAISINAKLLVLDEPTLGLDILYRKQFYEQLLNDYFDENKTILITTHQVEEIEHVLTDLLFIKNGSAILSMEMEQIAEHFIELEVGDQNLSKARTLKPIFERASLGTNTLLFEGVPALELAELGNTKTPSVADLFVAKMS